MTPDDDLHDEVDLALLDIMSYARRYGVSGDQLHRFMCERLEAAFAALDEFEDRLSDVNVKLN